MKKFTALFIFALMMSYCYGQSFINGSLEFWSSSTVCETNLPPDGWSNYSNVGLGPDEGNLPLCPSTIPPSAADGDIYARCLAGNPNTGEGMYQNVSGFIPGGLYRIIYSFSGSNRWGGSGDCVWHLFMDDIDVNQSPVFSSSDSVWQTNFYMFIATMPMHKIAVRAYTPTFNGGGSAGIDRFIVMPAKPTGIEDGATANSISIYPNPSSGSFKITGMQHANAELEIFNTVGAKIYSGILSSANVELNVASGIYFVRVSDGEKTRTQKLIIQ
jgi:hypothetical protein